MRLNFSDVFSWCMTIYDALFHFADINASSPEASVLNGSGTLFAVAEFDRSAQAHVFVAGIDSAVAHRLMDSESSPSSRFNTWTQESVLRSSQRNDFLHQNMSRGAAKDNDAVRNTFEARHVANMHLRQSSRVSKDGSLSLCRLPQ